MLQERVSKGIQTYGTTLQTFNGRSAVLDAMEEAVDLFQYLCQIELEGLWHRAGSHPEEVGALVLVANVMETRFEVASWNGVHWLHDGAPVAFPVAYWRYLLPPMGVGDSGD